MSDQIRNTLTQNKYKKNETVNYNYTTVSVVKTKIDIDKDVLNTKSSTILVCI